MFDTAAVADLLRAELDLLRAAGHDRSVADLVTVVEQCQSVINQASALQIVAMAHVAAIEDVVLEDGTVVEQHRGLGHQRLDAPALVSEPLGLSDAAACSRMTVAVEAVTKVPVAILAMAAGRLDAHRAAVVCEELRDAPPEVSHEVGSRIREWLGAEPPSALRRRVRRALGAVDADLVRARAARARLARSLRRWPGEEPGVDTWMGSFPVEQARSGWAVIDRLAREYVREGRATRVEEARADALMDLIHSRATGSFVLQLAVPADRLESRGAEAPTSTLPAPTPTPGVVAVANEPAAHAQDAVVTVAGLGMPGGTQVRQAWLSSLASGSARASVVLCHADTGALLGDHRLATDGRPRATESQSYRPPPALVELVRTRDGRCRFPGCNVSAVHCDIDHVRPWPAGPTRPTNLMCLCRRHHRIKQTARWRVRIAPDASVTWTDPVGRRRTTLPLDFLQLDPDGQPGPDGKRPGDVTSDDATSDEERQSLQPWAGQDSDHHVLGQDSDHQVLDQDSDHQVLDQDSDHQVLDQDSDHQVLDQDSDHQVLDQDSDHQVLDQDSDHQVLDPGRRGLGPAAEGGVLWSAWEDELAHLQSRAERDQRRAAGGSHGGSRGASLLAGRRLIVERSVLNWHRRKHTDGHRLRREERRADTREGRDAAAAEAHDAPPF